MEEEATSSTMEEKASRANRKRKAPLVQNVVNEKVRVPWKVEEKSALFNAVKKHGHKDLNILHSLVPTKSKQQILSYLRIRETEARKSVKNRERTKLDLWLDMVKQILDKKKDYSQLLSKVMNIVSMQEIRSAKKDGGDESQHNPAQIYKSLISLISEKDFTELSQENCEVLTNLMEMLSKIVMEVRPSLQEEINFISTWSPKSESNQQNSTDAQNQPEVASNNIQDVNLGLNPFNIPVSMVKQVHDRVNLNPACQNHIEEFVNKTVDALIRKKAIKAMTK